MSLDLLPANFDDRVEKAVQTFWRTRDETSARHTQGGSRDAVIGGKNMDGFIALVRTVAAHCGLP